MHTSAKVQPSNTHGLVPEICMHSFIHLPPLSLRTQLQGDAEQHRTDIDIDTHNHIDNLE